MTNIHPKFGIPMTSEEYAQEWKENALYFESNRHYSWMIEQLGDAATVLEIGCGSGLSTLGLVRAGRRVVAIEVNQHLISLAASYLTEQGVTVEILDKNELSQLQVNNGAEVSIVCADVFDLELPNLLPASVFDAMVCWLTGAEPEQIGKQLGKDFMQFTGEEMSKYRLQLQTRCYELGRITLKSGGVVQVVDRCALSSWNDKNEMRSFFAEKQKELAGENYSITRESVYLTKIGDGFLTSKISYIAPAAVTPSGVSVLSSSKAVLTE